MAHHRHSAGNGTGNSTLLRLHVLFVCIVSCSARIWLPSKQGADGRLNACYNAYKRGGTLLVQCGAPTTSQLAVNLFPDSYGPDGRVNTPMSDREPSDVHDGETNQIPEEFLAITDHSIILIPTEAKKATINASSWTASGMGGLSTNWGGTSGVTMAQAYTSYVGSNSDGLGADAERSKLSMGYISYFVKYDNVSMGENQFIVSSPQSLSYYLNGCPNYNAGETSQNMDWVCPTKTVNAGTFKFSVLGMMSGSQINSGATASFAQTSLRSKSGLPRYQQLQNDALPIDSGRGWHG